MPSAYLGKAEVIEVPVEPSCAMSGDELELEVGSTAIYPALHRKRRLKSAGRANIEEQPEHTEGVVDSLSEFCMPSSCCVSGCTI